MADRENSPRGRRSSPLAEMVRADSRLYMDRIGEPYQDYRGGSCGDIYGTFVREPATRQKSSHTDDTLKKKRVKKVRRGGGSGTDAPNTDADFDDSASVSSDHSKEKKKRLKTCPIHGKAARKRREREIGKTDVTVRDSLVTCQQFGPNDHYIPSRALYTARQKISCDNRLYGGIAKPSVVDIVVIEDRRSPSQIRHDDITSGEIRKTPPPLKCTCRRKKSAPRPEPEGGPLQNVVQLDALQEYDKIINNNDPLFSDLEDDPQLDLQIRQESERFHKRSMVSRAATVTGGIFSAAQLVNSNTMIKFAIIQAELKNIIEVSLRRVYIYLLLLARFYS